jgi:hypothetical protein
MEEAIEPSVQEETKESTGLLDQATIETEEASDKNPQEVEIDHRDPAEVKAKEEYALSQEQDDDEPLEKPDWWPENFWKKEDAAPDLEGIAKSWMDLRKQISQGKHKAPADGNYDLSAFGETPDDDPVKQHVVSWAKENSISQAALDELVGQVVDMGLTNQQQEEISIKEEMKLLGPNAQARINSTATWLRGLSQKGILSKEDMEEAQVMAGTARAISIFEKIRGSLEGRIPVETTPIDGAPTKEELQQLVADPKYQTDPAYRQKVERAFQQVYG